MTSVRHVTFVSCCCYMTSSSMCMYMTGFIPSYLKVVCNEFYDPDEGRKLKHDGLTVKQQVSEFSVVSNFVDVLRVIYTRFTQCGFLYSFSKAFISLKFSFYWDIHQGTYKPCKLRSLDCPCLLLKQLKQLSNNRFKNNTGTDN